ncbi:hypothetical protein MLD38_005838 [Melastoma candidum]|uniref:Uncharacterized protein n=1 Tax=Melastoma candidum TaxID=119954 RepID=A0ACB9RKQ3_9MYRT|nr:hypothetical protein MLD38_005838 [Melastoma candidum]
MEVTGMRLEFVDWPDWAFSFTVTTNGRNPKQAERGFQKRCRNVQIDDKQLDLLRPSAAGSKGRERGKYKLIRDVEDGQFGMFLMGFSCPLMWYYATTVLYFGNFSTCCKDPSHLFSSQQCSQVLITSIFARSDIYSLAADYRSGTYIDKVIPSNKHRSGDGEPTSKVYSHVNHF